MNTNNQNKNVGWPIARDKNGILVNACDAKSGEDYKCPNCDCIMRPKTRLGTSFYAKLPGQVHKNPICDEIERTGKCHSFSKSESPTALILSIIRPAVKRGPGGNKGPGNPGGGPKGGDDNPTVLPFKSLKQIYEYGRCQNNPYERCGNYTISDFYIHFIWLPYILKNTNVLGARIVHAKFEFCDVPSNSLVFQSFKYSREERKILFQAKFKITFSKRKECNDFLNKVTEKSLDENTGKIEIRGKTALLASSDWGYISENECKILCSESKRANCANCKGMYTTQFMSKGQIFVTPEEH